MRKIVSVLLVFIMLSCGSSRSFQSFFNNHKNDLGVTAFQVPNFMKAILGSISPDIEGIFRGVRDFKFITFNEMSQAKRTQLLGEINAITENRFIDVLRVNSQEKTKIVSIVEEGDVVKKVLIFNTTENKASAFYLKGNFNPNTIRQVSKTNQFEDLSDKLLQHYKTPLSSPTIQPIKIN